MNRTRGRWRREGNREERQMTAKCAGDVEPINVCCLASVTTLMLIEFLIIGPPSLLKGIVIVNQHCSGVGFGWAVNHLWFLVLNLHHETDFNFLFYLVFELIFIVMRKRRLKKIKRMFT